MINGNTQGIRQALLEQMETMQQIECERDEFLPEELMRQLARYTGLLGREISVYLSRGGDVLDVTVGDAQTVSLASVNTRRSLTRLSGVRCIHTHPGGDSTLSGVDLQSLQRLRLDAMAAIGVNAEGQATALSVAFLGEPAEDGQYNLLLTKPFSPAELTARVDALFRRTGGEEPAQSGEIWQEPFLLNTRNRTLEKNGQRIKLTQVEYSIMRVFMENPGKALSREEILDRVWGRDYFGELKIVDVNVRRLRLKIEDNVQNPTYITTVWGYGYKWGF